MKSRRDVLIFIWPRYNFSLKFLKPPLKGHGVNFRQILARIFKIPLKFDLKVMASIFETKFGGTFASFGPGFLKKKIKAPFGHGLDF